MQTLTTVLAAACAAALALSVAAAPAEARKSAGFKGTATGTNKAPPSPTRIIRDHRDGPQALPPGKGACWGPNCSKYVCGYKGTCPTVRDHRTPKRPQCKGPGCPKP